jgi:hypothetical protein
MKRILCACVLILGMAGFCPAEDQKTVSEKEQWVPLFNGKNLDGWTPKLTGYPLGENYNDTFRVQDGVLKVSYDKYEKFGGQFGHLFYKTPFSHYILRAEYRFAGPQVKDGPGWAFRNSGFMIHCQDPNSMDLKQKFPICLEVQLLGGNDTDQRPTGNLCTPGTNVVIDGKLVTDHCINSKSKTFHGDQWVTVEIEVHGSGLVRHKINGQTVMEYTQPQYDLRDTDAKKLIKGDNLLISQGYISLQAESHPVEFRKVEIKLLEE